MVELAHRVDVADALERVVDTAVSDGRARQRGRLPFLGSLESVIASSSAHALGGVVLTPMMPSAAILRAPWMMVKPMPPSEHGGIGYRPLILDVFVEDLTVLSQPASRFVYVWDVRPHDVPESRRVVGLQKVGKFMDDYVIDDEHGRLD